MQGAVNKKIASVFLPVASFAYVAFYLKQHQPSAAKLIELPDWQLFFLNRDGEVLYPEAQIQDKFAMTRVKDICNDSPFQHIREARIKSETNPKLQRRMLEHFRKKEGASANDFNSFAWEIVKKKNESPEQYGFALEAAVIAVRLLPPSDSCLDTLGVAQYRWGDYSAVIQTSANASG